jgi:hypothetical protein
LSAKNIDIEIKLSYGMEKICDVLPIILFPPIASIVVDIIYVSTENVRFIVEYAVEGVYVHIVNKNLDAGNVMEDRCVNMGEGV